MDKKKPTCQVGGTFDVLFATHHFGNFCCQFLRAHTEFLGKFEYVYEHFGYSNLEISLIHCSAMVCGFGFSRNLANRLAQMKLTVTNDKDFLFLF